MAFISRAFISRVLLNHIRHVQKDRVLSAACILRSKLPAVAVAQAHVASTAATSLNEGKQNSRYNTNHLVWC